MPPSGSDWADNPGLAAQAIVNNNERELLRRIWLEADSKSTAFLSIDTEFTSKGICELGIATRTKGSETRTRHLVITSTRKLRTKDPKPFKFGQSEEIRKEADLRPILNAALSDLQLAHDVVVLVGHDVQNDLGNLKKHCGWQVPNQIIVLDTLHIWRAWVNVPHRGNLEQALDTFALLDDSECLHNAGNDAKYTMELLVRKANQAVESPIPWDRSDHEVRHGQAGGRVLRSGKRQLQAPTTTTSGCSTGKKRKREAEPSSRAPRLAPSPEPLVTRLRRVESDQERKRQRIDSGATAAGMRSAVPPTAPRAMLPMKRAATRAPNPKGMDLPGGTLPRQQPAWPRPELIDLTGDSPSPEARPQQRLTSCKLHFHDCACVDSMDVKDEPMPAQPKQAHQDQKHTGLFQDQDTDSPATRHQTGLPPLFQFTGSNALGSAATSNKWWQDTKNMTWLKSGRNTVQPNPFSAQKLTQPSINNNDGGSIARFVSLVSRSVDVGMKDVVAPDGGGEHGRGHKR
jgi:hypothetical protein